MPASMPGFSVERFKPSKRYASKDMAIHETLKTVRHAGNELDNVFVALKGDEVVGVGLTQINIVSKPFAHPHEEQLGYGKHLCLSYTRIARAFRGNGLATLIGEFAAAHAKELDCKKAYCKTNAVNTSARRQLEKVGFKEYYRETTDLANIGLNKKTTWIYYSKNL